VDKQKLEEARQLAMSMTSHPVAFGTIEHTEKAGELLGLLWQEVLRLQCDLKDANEAVKDALEPQSPNTADGPVALELSWVPLNKRDLNWHAHATVQLRSMHAALSAAEKTPRDPLEIEELWDEANELATGDGPEPHELFARLLERAHGIGGEHG
jgi:hypothetical protein